MTLDQRTLRELTNLSDPLGVLSVYVSEGITEKAEQPAWWLRTQNALDDVLNETRNNGSREQDMALRRSMDELADEMMWLRDPAEFGRGRALFAPLSGGDVERVAIQLPLDSLAVCEPTAYIRPLMDAWSDGSPAGIAVVGGDGLRIIDYRFGIAEDVATMGFHENTEEWQRFQGPATTNPTRMRHAALQYDRFDYRLSEHLKHFLAATYNALEGHARRRGWEFLVVTGEPQLRDTVIERLGRELPAEVVASTQVIGPASPSQIAEAVVPDLDAARLRRDNTLVDQILNNKLVAVGVDQTLAAVQEGKAENVLMSRDGQWTGRSSDDGQYVAEGVEPPGVGYGEWHTEPDLAERIIELTLANDSHMNMVRPEVAERMSGADGLAATLRW